MRRAAALLLVLVLLGAAASAGFLFDVEVEDRPSQRTDQRKTYQSVYASGLVGGALCRPEVDELSERINGDSVEAIAADVERLRDLTFTSEPEVEFLTPDELEDHVAESSRKELDDATAEIETQALQQIGLIPEDFDIEDFIEGASQQVLGLYDPRDERLLVGNSGSLDPQGRLTIAHELDHALTDQVLGFPDLRFDPEQADAQLAERALIEGDATLLMAHYGLIAFPDDLQEILGGSATPEQQREYDELPHYLRRALAFPYQEGFLFTCDIYTRGGWSVIDDAYESPPASTLEILFPDLYGKLEPEAPAELDAPEGDWELVEVAALGAADLQWMFESPGGVAAGNPAEAAQQVSRWRGGRFHIWQRADELTVAMAIVEGRDLSGGDSSSICDLLIEWYAASEPDATFTVDEGTKGAWTHEDVATAVDCRGRQTRFVSAPDMETALHVAEFR